MAKKSAPTIDSDLMLAELLAHKGPPIDVVSLVVTRDRNESSARAIMLTDLLATGRAALWVEHDGNDGRLVVEPVRTRR